MNETENKDESKAIGGNARAASLTPERRKEIAKAAAAARWTSEFPKATHEGDLPLGNLKVACAVLENGQRVITQSGFMQALGRARQAKGRPHYGGDANMPAFLTAMNLKPFISKDLLATTTYIEFRTLRGSKAFGYAAELLPKVCDVFIDAEEAGALVPGQIHIATRSKLLMRALAHVGIIALVDEATGYQEIRDRLALQAILDQFLRKELAAWAKRFPDEFYKQIFRLRGWKWQGMKINRPQIVANYTNDFVYERLLPGIREELEQRNPKTESGKRKNKHHQWFTDDVGHPALAQHLYAVITLMKASKNWNDFKFMLDQALPKRNSTPMLGFTE